MSRYLDKMGETANGVVLLAAAYVALHVFLDGVSWVHGLQNLLITPWNPVAGLALAFLLLAGIRYFPAVMAGCLMADLLVRGSSFHLLPSLVFALLFALSYVACALLLKRHRIGLDALNLRDVLLIAIIGSGTALIIGTVHVATLIAFDMLSLSRLGEALPRYWVGDVIGIITTAPLILVLWPHRKDLWGLLQELVWPLAAVATISWITFGVKTTNEFKLFYLLFLPLIWMAVRHGMKGAVIGIAATQICMMAITTLLGYEAATVTSFQILMLVLTLTALLLAAVVDERARAESNLHDHQMSLAQMTRLSLAGEMASGLAHELNQPLTAIVNYIKAAQGLLQGPSSRLADAQDALGKASSQAMRASQIIGRLREFLQKGEMALSPVSLSDLVAEALALIASTAKRSQVRIAVQLAPPLPKVMVDRIHIEQVLLNLLLNAIEATSDRKPDEREIAIEARLRSDGMAEISVRDNGPGIDPEIEGRLFEPFASSKSEGMGLGLMICRTIVEAHGGSLWHDDKIGGATIFRFTLLVDASA